MTEHNRKHSWADLAIETFRKAKPYHLFEHLIANILVLLISFIVIVALYKLGEDVVSLLVSKAFDPLKHETFQTVFGGIMTLLIARSWFSNRPLALSVALHRPPKNPRSIISDIPCRNLPPFQVTFPYWGIKKQYYFE